MLDIDVPICDRGARFVISGSKSVIGVPDLRFQEMEGPDL